MRKIILTVDGTEIATTLDSFLADNDGMSDEEIAIIRAAVENGCEYDGGGGASPAWNIRAI
jgi:hypothetical protein